MTRIAVLGTGEMGARMARNLLAAGHEVTVFNRTRARAAPLADAGARVAPTAREAAAGAGLVMAMVADDTAARAMWTGDAGALAGMDFDAVAVESSTTSVAWVRELAALAAERDLAFIDAPVVGTLPQAEARALVHLVGGPDDAVARALPVLAAMSAAQHHVGPLGQGMALKLAVNGLYAVQVAAMAELLGVLDNAGVDEHRAADVMGDLAVMSPALRAATVGMVARSFAPQFPVRLVAKDMRLLQALAADAGGGAPVSARAGGVYADAEATGEGDRNITVIALAYLPGSSRFG